MCDEKVTKTEAKRQTQKDRQKSHKKIDVELMMTLTWKRIYETVMRAIAVRKRRHKWVLREFCVGTSRDENSRWKTSVGSFRWVTSALKRFELSGIDTRVRGNPEARRS